MTKERIESCAGVGAAFVGLAFGEASCGLSAGWPSDTSRDFFQVDDEADHGWPRRARGLPLPIRRGLRLSGLHAIHTQMAMACISTRRDESVDWLVTGFELGSWRNYPRGLVSMAHRQRVEYASRLTKDVEVRPGPIGAAVAFLNHRDATERRRVTSSVMSALYGDDLTTLVGVLLGDVLARLNDGDLLSFAEAVQDLRSWPGSEGLGVERLEQNSDLERGLLGHYGQMIRAIKLGLESQDEPGAILQHLLLEGGASDTAGAAAGAILAARHGIGWCDTSRLVSEQRVLGCAAWLDGESSQPESLESFLEAESVLTRQEMAFRDEMMAERRTSPRR